MGRPLKIAKAQALLTLTNTTASTNVITVSQSNIGERVLAGMPFIPASSIGGLVEGTTYWILQITGSSTFTASDTPIDANTNRTPITLSTASGSVVLTVGVVDAYFNNPNPSNGPGYPATNSDTYGVVGGNTVIYGNQVLAQVAISNTQTGTIRTSTSSPTITGVGTALASVLSNGTGISLTDGTFVGFVTDVANATATSATLTANAAVAASDERFVIANDEDGFIVRQKGKTKYLVQGLSSELVGACFTANSAGAALRPGEMNITADYTSGSKWVRSLSDRQSEVFPDTVAASALTAGERYTVYSVGTTNWTSVGAFGNMTGITFTATGAGSGTGTAVLANTNPGVIASFNPPATPDPANGQPTPVVQISRQ